MEKIKDVNEFKKLYKIPIPKQDEFEYYITTLLKSKKFEKLNQKIKLFSELEKFCIEKGFSSVADYKLGVILKKTVEYIKNTKTFKKLNEFDYSTKQIRTKNELKLNRDTKLISIDISKANYNTFKLFDNNDEMFKSWDEFLRFFNTHQAIIESKSFRQIVFGNINPKRTQKIQHFYMLDFVDVLLKKINENDIVFISHDEIILKYTNTIYEIILNTKEQFNMFDFHETIFELNEVDKKNKVTVKTNFVLKNFGFGGIRLTENYKELVGIPSNRFYVFFKQYVLNEDVEERDLFFYENQMLAKWVLD